MRYLWIVLLCGSNAWASSEFTAPQPVYATCLELTEEAKAAVPSVEGADCFSQSARVNFRGEFTAAERQTLQAVINAHDPEIRTRKAQQQQSKRRDARQKLETLGLTHQELDALLGD